jgi:preprotein translocase subunit Sec63
MSMSEAPTNNIDPYSTLGLAPDASDEEIRVAFHALVKKFPQQKQLHDAYTAIRNQTARNLHKWNNLCSFIANPYRTNHATEELDLEALIKEFAFLSEWEAGDIENV